MKDFLNKDISIGDTVILPSYDEFVMGIVLSFDNEEVHVSIGNNSYSFNETQLIVWKDE